MCILNLVHGLVLYVLHYFINLITPVGPILAIFMALSITNITCHIALFLILLLIIIIVCSKIDDEISCPVQFLNYKQNIFLF